MEQSKTKKRGTFAAKIIVMVILAVIVSNVWYLFLKAPKNKLQTAQSIPW